MFIAKKHIKNLFFSLLVLISTSAAAQNKSISDISYIKKLLKQDSTNKAKTELSKQIDFFISQKNYDTLVDYLSVMGNIKSQKREFNETVKVAEDIVTFIKESENPETIKEALLGLSNLFFNARDFTRNYKTNIEALEYAKKIKPEKASDLSKIEYNLGTIAINLNNLQLAKEHLFQSKKILETNPDIEKEQFYLTYNSLGRIKASLLELDSSSFYYNKSLKILNNMGDTPINKYYRAAIVKQNIALNLFNSGKIEASIKTGKEAVLKFQEFLNTSDNEAKKIRARRFRLSAIDNLGGFYSGIGDNKSAVDVLTYSYNEKLKVFSEDDPNVIISTLILGHVNLIAKNFEDAGTFIDKGLKHIKKTPYYEDYALMLRASVHDNTGDVESAKRTYEKSEAIYRKQSPNSYPFNFLEAILEMSNFYAKNGFKEKAIGLATESYNHTSKSDFNNPTTKFQHTENLASIHYTVGNYNDALKYSNEALAMNLKMDGVLDSIKHNIRKPRTLYINAKSKYELNTSKNSEFLNGLLSQIKSGIQILEQRKTVVNSSEDVSSFISENNELFGFAKQICLDLYKLTNQEYYLNELISIHESSIYNRIRSQLNIRTNIAFADIPLKATKREILLKKNLENVLNDSNENTIESFFSARNDWNTFLDSLKTAYPKYYKMRYASIEVPLDNLKKNIPENTSIVRYIFINNTLYASVIDNQKKHLIEVNQENIGEIINQLSDHQLDFNKTSTSLHQLYQQIWKPLENHISTENIIIIPDGVLFNLSFESLTPVKNSSFEDLATNSLLSKHAISYNYSLLLLNQERKTVNYQKNFIAFAPEFNDTMKQDYKVAIEDSVSIDKTYLTLLPQPFSVDLAKEYSKVFNGDFFVNENASKQIFKNEANEHKIIHIGTHAESNNVSPELSRLIFAKSSETEDNSLYTFEIYNENLNSNLAILTACETGKPTYQSGEGMISLAHAFNYAGSESILTSLWKIDEKASSEIIELFYKNIKNGLPKDKALQQAKLNYIKNAEGRTITPQYWSGLVLIGDTSPIDLTSSSSTTIWYILSALLLIFATIYLIKSSKK